MMTKQTEVLKGYGVTGGDVIRMSMADIRGRARGLRSSAYLDREDPGHRTNSDGSLQDSRYPDAHFSKQAYLLLRAIQRGIGYIKHLNGDPDGRTERARALGLLDELFDIVHSVWTQQSGRNTPPTDELLEPAEVLSHELYSIGRIIARLVDDPLLQHRGSNARAFGVGQSQERRDVRAVLAANGIDDRMLKILQLLSHSSCALTRGEYLDSDLQVSPRTRGQSIKKLKGSKRGALVESVGRLGYRLTQEGRNFVLQIEEEIARL